jgi:hypothetical protein
VQLAGQSSFNVFAELKLAQQDRLVRLLDRSEPAAVADDPCLCHRKLCVAENTFSPEAPQLLEFSGDPACPPDATHPQRIVRVDG